MLTAYRRVLVHPGALAFCASGLVARLPIAMMTLGIVVLVSRQTGSYALAGQVSAAYVMGNAVASVPQGRLADRLGQVRLLGADAVLFALATTLLLVSVLERAPAPWPHLWAALAGATLPPIGAMVRARWAHLLVGAGERHTAFALESVVDEVVFVAGPTAVTVLSTSFSPQTGLVVALLAGTVGTALLAIQHRSAPPVEPRSTTVARARLPVRLLLPATLAAGCLGAVFGALEVGAVAFAADVGRPGAAGVLLAILSVASLLAGVVTGSRSWSASVVRRLRLGMAAVAVGLLATPLAGGLATLAPVMFLAGLGIAPTLIALFSLVEAGVPRSRLTEVLGVVHTGMAAGIAPGAWLAGEVADRSSGSAAFWVCVTAALVGVLATLAVPTQAIVAAPEGSDLSDPAAAGRASRA